MLVIFDLDDTLIETSACLTPHYLMRAYEAMQLPEASLAELIELNEQAKSAKDAVREFWRRYSLDEDLCQIGLNALNGPLPKGVPIKLVPGALELLDELQVSHTLALVTIGDEEFQLAKMEKAGIQPKRFSKLIVNAGSSKKNSYQCILQEFDADPKDVIVCGDRVAADLSPAKELGIYTVHFRNGRGMVHNLPQKDVDMTINALSEFNEVFVEHES